MAIKGCIAWNKGKKLSKEHVKNLSISHKGQKPNKGNFKKGNIPWNKGVKGYKNGTFSLETRKKMSNSAKGKSKIWLVGNENGFKKNHLPWNKGLIGYLSGENHYNWQGGKSFEPYPLGWNKTFKEQIRYRDEYKCQLCGCSEIENCRTLDVHHIDYNKKSLDINNLISLCISCHCKTNHNRDKWQKYFKELMEQKYVIMD